MPVDNSAAAGPMPRPVGSPPAPTEVQWSDKPNSVDTQSAEITPTPLQPPSSMPKVGTGDDQPPAPPAGSFFHNLSHSFAGAILGAMAGREKTTGYTTDATGKQTPVESKMTSGDQLRQIARSALLGLAAGANAPKQKSGLASALGGLGAGAEDAVDRAKQEDLLKRKQSSEEFAREQQATNNKSTNAHLIVENIKAVQEIRNMDLENQGKFAALGQDAMAAAVAGGNQVPVQDMHMDELMKYRQEHPEYLNYTPVLTKVTPKEGTDPADPANTGVDRFYSLVDYTKPVEITPGMKAHLQAVGFPGAESLEAGQKVDPQQFKGLWYQGLKLYNNALMDPKNKDVIDVTLPGGTVAKAVYNKTLNTTEVLRDEKGQPLGGKVETGETKLLGGDGKTYAYLYNKQTGKLIKNMGAAPSTESSMMQTWGDMGLYGKDYLATVPEPVKSSIQGLIDYSVTPQDFGRSGGGRMGLIAGAEHADPTFDEKLYKERYDYIKQYQSSNTGDGASRTRLNTAVGHLDMLAQAATALAKNDVLWFNKVANEFGYQTGTSPKVAYEVIGQKSAGEAAGAVKGGGSAVEAEIDKQAQYLTNASLSPAQHQSAARETLRLLKTQSETLENNFKQAMGKGSKESGRPVLFPQNEAIMNKWTTPSGNGQVPAGVPKNASHIYTDANNNVVGYALGGKYVAIGGK